MRLEGEVVGVVVLNGGDDGLHKLKEDNEIEMHPHFPTSLHHCLTDLFHGLCMSVGDRKVGLVLFSLNWVILQLFFKFYIVITNMERNHSTWQVEGCHIPY